MKEQKAQAEKNEVDLIVNGIEVKLTFAEREDPTLKDRIIAILDNEFEKRTLE